MPFKGTNNKHFDRDIYMTDYIHVARTKLVKGFEIKITCSSDWRNCSTGDTDFDSWRADVFFNSYKCGTEKPYNSELHCELNYFKMQTKYETKNTIT